MRNGNLQIGWIALLLLSLVAAVSVFAQIPTLHPRGGDSNSNEPVDGVYRVGRDIKPPRVTYQLGPEFSEQARQAGYEGTCILELVVDAEGIPQNIRVTRPRAWDSMTRPLRRSGSGDSHLR